MSRRYFIIAICIVAMLIPFPTTVVPEWKIRVVDKSGKPIAGEHIREMWQHYSLESDGHEEELVTDGNGYVVFSQRRIWFPLLGRIVFTGLAALLTLAHGSMGVSAWVMVPNYSTNGGTRNYEPGKPLPQEIVLPR